MATEPQVVPQLRTLRVTFECGDEPYREYIELPMNLSADRAREVLHNESLLHDCVCGERWPADEMSPCTVCEHNCCQACADDCSNCGERVCDGCQSRCPWCDEPCCGGHIVETDRGAMCDGCRGFQGE